MGRGGLIHTARQVRLWNKQYLGEFQGARFSVELTLLHEQANASKKPHTVLKPLEAVRARIPGATLTRRGARCVKCVGGQVVDMDTGMIPNGYCEDLVPYSPLQVWPTGATDSSTHAGR